MAATLEQRPFGNTGEKVTVIGLGGAFVLIANQEISTILVGASTPEEIEESVMAAQAGPLPSDLVRSLEELGSNTGYYENLVG